LHKTKLTWLLAKVLADKTKNELYAMQADFSDGILKKVEIKDFQFALFGGFYLTVIRGNVFTDY
jgi:hypothetical protein